VSNGPLPAVISSSVRTFGLVVFVGILIGSSAATRADSNSPPTDRLGPSASVGIGAGYSVTQHETGGVSVGGLADLGWFFTDRFAVLVGATLTTRFGDPDIHHTLFRLGVEYRLDARHYLRLSAGPSIVTRGRDENASSEGFETIGTGEGAQIVAGVPAHFFRFGELSFQVVAGGGVHRGDDDESEYTGFVATCLELAVR